MQNFKGTWELIREFDKKRRGKEWAATSSDKPTKTQRRTKHRQLPRQEAAALAQRS